MIKLKELLNEKKSEQYKQHRNEFIEAVNNFGSLGQNIYKSGKDLKEISETINRICGMAEVFTMEESADWFDEVTVKRNIGSLYPSPELITKVLPLLLGNVSCWLRTKPKNL